jgi:hypothetical protein
VRQPHRLLTIQSCLGCRLAHFKLRTRFLQARRKRFDLLFLFSKLELKIVLLLRDSCFLLACFGRAQGRRAQVLLELLGCLFHIRIRGVSKKISPVAEAIHKRCESPVQFRPGFLIVHAQLQDA